jgi:hypothetical protein
MGKRTGNQIMHKMQAGITAYKSLLRLAAQHIRPVFTGTGQACQIAIVSGINTIDNTLFRIRQYSKHIADKIQLQFAGLATGHIQIQVFMLQFFISRHQLLEFHPKFFTASARIGSHIHHPFAGGN